MEPDNSSSSPQSALLSFTAENARSYLNEAHLSLLAGRRSADSPARPLATAGQRVRVLPSAGIFGANASGKSTLLMAMADLRRLVLDSFHMWNRLDGDPEILWTLYQPFQAVGFSASKRTSPPHGITPFRQVVRPTRFSVDLLIDGVRWQYGLEVVFGYVVSEHAYHYPHGRQALVFRRERDPAGRGAEAISDIVFGSSFRARGGHLEQFVRRGVLLLSVAGAAGFEPLAPLFGWFKQNLEFSEPGSRRGDSDRTVELLNDAGDCTKVLALIRAADLGIVGATSDPIDPESQPPARGQTRVRDGDYNEADFADGNDPPPDGPIRLIHRGPWGDAPLFRHDESMGTLTWVALVGPVLDALRRGSVLLVDELDSSLHPHLVRDVVRLFQDPRTNPNMAQLIFNAHDVTLLGDSADRALGRDQIWITEKAEDGVTTLTPLSDYRPRHDEAIERRYMQGRYGGVPTINPAEYARATEQINA